MEGELRAYLDGELAAPAHESLTRHLGSCNRCAEAVSQLQQAILVVECRWQTLAPRTNPSPARALVAFSSRAHAQSYLGGVWMRTNRSRVWRPVLAGALALAVVVGVFSFAPSRALARQLLSVFRVRQFAAIQIDPNQERLAQIDRQLAETLFVSEPETLADAPAVAVGSLEEAQALAGFAARMPAFFPGGGSPQYDVKGRTAYALRFSGDALRTLLAMAEMDPDLAPADLGEAQVTVELPASVHIGNGNVDVIQVLEPRVEYPEGLDARVIGEAGLRLMGLSPAEARRIARSIDWASTLVLPVPAAIASFQEVVVAGEVGVLLTPRDLSGGERRMLLWQKDGIVYIVTGSMAGETLVQVAESMF
jgi:anti-sigma factor RsiW